VAAPTRCNLTKRELAIIAAGLIVATVLVVLGTWYLVERFVAFDPRDPLPRRAAQLQRRTSGRSNSEMSETEEQICASCGTVRKEVFSEPVSRGYELRTLVCPQCKSVLKFVCERPVKSHRRIAWSELGLRAKGK
jgi:hypothetical protein